ncbi:hypothetical protein [Paraconexibacter sp. AEG42_29]|uniref:CBM96 family carbohydrate-binding protein n=1 Tax=Paraconexibacter sp. AEG42_29 TaxID=2997339 RepID=UPI00339D70D7
MRLRPTLTLTTLAAVATAVAAAGTTATVTATARAALPVPQAVVTADVSLSRAAGGATGGTRAPTLRAGGGTSAFLRVRVAALPVPPARVVLRLWVTRGSDAPTTVSLTTTDWNQRTVTPARSPTAVTGPIATLPAVTAGQWAEYDVTAAVVTDSTLGFRIDGDRSRPAGFASRESSRPPELVITTKSPGDELTWRLARPKNAARVRYRATDDRGGKLDALKVVQAPDGRYLGVWHADVDGRFVSRVGTSSDLLRWRRTADLGDHDSQPTVALLPGGGALVVSEADDGGPHLRFRRFPTVDALLAGRPDATFDAPRSLAPVAEGTPSIRSVDAGAQHVVVGFHYLRDSVVDRRATGLLLGMRAWAARADGAADALFTPLGLGGGLGDRDELTFRGQRFTLQEGQHAFGDFGSWREYLEDQATGTAQLLPVATHGYSQSFGNGTATMLIGPDGRLTLVGTYFVFTEGSGSGEAGELIYVSPLDDVPAPGVPADPGVPPDTTLIPALPVPVRPVRPPDAPPAPAGVAAPTTPRDVVPNPEPVTTTPAAAHARERTGVRRALAAVRPMAARRSMLLRSGGRYQLRLALPPGRLAAELWTPSGRLVARVRQTVPDPVTVALSLPVSPSGRSGLRAVPAVRGLELRLTFVTPRGATVRRSATVRVR